PCTQGVNGSNPLFSTFPSKKSKFKSQKRYSFFNFYFLLFTWKTFFDILRERRHKRRQQQCYALSLEGVYIRQRYVRQKGTYPRRKYIRAHGGCLGSQRR